MTNKFTPWCNIINEYVLTLSKEQFEAKLCKNPNNIICSGIIFKDSINDNSKLAGTIICTGTCGPIENTTIKPLKSCDRLHFYNHEFFMCFWNNVYTNNGEHCLYAGQRYINGEQKELFAYCNSPNVWPWIKDLIYYVIHCKEYKNTNPKVIKNKVYSFVTSIYIISSKYNNLVGEKVKQNLNEFLSMGGFTFNYNTGLLHNDNNEPLTLNEIKPKNERPNMWNTSNYNKNVIQEPKITETNTNNNKLINDVSFVDNLLIKQLITEAYKYYNNPKEENLDICINHFIQFILFIKNLDITIEKVYNIHYNLWNESNKTTNTYQTNITIEWNDFLYKLIGTEYKRQIITEDISNTLTIINNINDNDISLNQIKDFIQAFTTNQQNILVLCKLSVLCFSHAYSWMARYDTTNKHIVHTKSSSSTSHNNITDIDKKIDLNIITESVSSSSDINTINTSEKNILENTVSDNSDQQNTIDTPPCTKNENVEYKIVHHKNNRSNPKSNPKSKPKSKPKSVNIAIFNNTSWNQLVDEDDEDTKEVYDK